MQHREAFMRVVLTMPHAVQITAFGAIDQLHIVDQTRPEPGPDDVVVEVVAAGTNPGEIMIREGYLKDRFPMPFPFGQGTDFAGRVVAVGSSITTAAVGDEVLGFAHDRSAQASFVRVPALHVVSKPPSLDWYRAGSLQVAGTTAVAAVRAVAPKSGETVVVTGAAGGVGSFVTQLAVRSGARVLAVASPENASFLRTVGAEPIAYGDGLADRLKRAAPKIDALVDLYGQGYLQLGLDLGVDPKRMNTIIDFAFAAEHGIATDGAAAIGDESKLAAELERLAWSIAFGDLLAPIAAIYPSSAIHDAYADLARRKSHGKIVLDFSGAVTAPLRPNHD